MKQVKYFTIVLLLTMITGNIFSQTTSQKTLERTDSLLKDSLLVNIITFEIKDGWGYEIFINKKKYICQEYIPAISGLKRFESNNDANKVAKLVIDKISKGIIPPSVTIEELDSLKIKY
ncbi:MAG: DUF4907 domain-containing protein [Bacteroidales bacterium]|nr:DUF4907 domain-containing protein [Bacteroidales bacterium]